MATAELRTGIAPVGRTAASAFLGAYAGLWLVTALAALVAHGIGDVREFVATLYRPMLYPHAPADLASVARRFVDNATRAWPLVLALLPVSRRAWVATVADRVLAANLAVNAALVGGVIAVAGAGIAPYLIHLPVEWAALAATVAGWVAARRGASPALVVAHIAAFTLLLLVAACLETYAVPHL